jgi:hypothetical protein
MASHLLFDFVRSPGESAGRSTAGKTRSKPVDHQTKGMPGIEAGHALVMSLAGKSRHEGSLPASTSGNFDQPLALDLLEHVERLQRSVVDP